MTHAPKVKLSEADVTRQVCDFLAAEGWRGVRMNVGGVSYEPREGGGVVRNRRYVAFGEPGMPDWLFITYWQKCERVLWVEMKAPGKKPTAKQLAWHEAERRRGALVKVVDHFETFRDWYRSTF